MPRKKSAIPKPVTQEVMKPLREAQEHHAHIVLDAGLYRDLRILAASEGVRTVEVIRRALADYVRTHGVRVTRRSRS